MDMDLTVEDVRRIMESKKDRKFKIKNIYDNNLISIQEYVQILKDYPSHEYEQQLSDGESSDDDDEDEED